MAVVEDAPASPHGRWPAVAMAGAAAGLYLALSDYGAVWLWLPVLRDRIWLLLRLIAMLAPVGALLAVVGLGLLRTSRLVMAGRGPGWLWPVPLVLASALPLHLLAVALCSGGSMAQLAWHDALEWGLSIALPLGFGAGLLVAERLLTEAWARPLRWRWWSLGLLGLSFALGKVNQWVLPNLYEYLHALVALTAFVTATLGIWLAIELSPHAGLRRWTTRRAAVVMAALGLMWIAHVATLGHNLNVRVALFDARAATSRAMMTFTDPALGRLDLLSNGNRRVAVRSRVTHDTRGLAQHEGAHVVLITIDALRADHLSGYGYGRPTSPNLAKRSRDGARFLHAYAQAPHSSYSLTSLMTSEYVHEVVDLDRPLPEATLATTLAGAGYHTAAFFTDGIFHTEGARLAQYRGDAFGFALFDQTDRDAAQMTDRVLAEADRLVRQGEPPSLLWAHYFDVHEPYRADHFGKRDIDRYDSEIRRVDRELHRLLENLEQRFERDMVVAITADHGEEFRDHGGVYHGSTLYEEQVRVPLLIFAPSFEGREVQAPVEVVDVAPTLLGLVGVEPAASMRGRDLRPLAVGRESESGPVFSAVTYKRMVVRWPYKLIADLRFNLFQLYNLQEDPKERHNLANTKPELLAELKDEIYGWLDSLERSPNDRPVTKRDGERNWSQALHWGRLGDRRAVAPMSELLLDPHAPLELRLQAGQILAKLADPKSAKALVRGLSTEPPEVAAEAAIALGRMYDQRARGALRKLVHTEDPDVRARAAVSLGRLRDRAAVPALIDALWVAPSKYEREEAVRWLGRLGDERAVEPLLSLLPEFRLRYLVTVALGQIGDKRSYDARMDMPHWEHHANIRDNVIRGLGQLGDSRAVPKLVEIAETETGLKNLSESLVRLDAVRSGAIGGADVSKALRGAKGLGRCEEGPLRHDWNYLNRTYCETNRSRASLSLRVPAEIAQSAHGATLLLRLRRNNEAAEAAEVELALNTKPLESAKVDGNWTELRIDVPQGTLKPGRARLVITVPTPDATLSVDHALLVRRRGALAAKAE